MKNKKVSKILLGTSILVSTSIIPAIVLTSCSSNSVSSSSVVGKINSLGSDVYVLAEESDYLENKNYIDYDFGYYLSNKNNEITIYTGQTKKPIDGMNGSRTIKNQFVKINLTSDVYKIISRDDLKDAGFETLGGSSNISLTWKRNLPYGWTIDSNNVLKNDPKSIIGSKGKLINLVAELKQTKKDGILIEKILSINVQFRPGNSPKDNINN